MSGKDRLWAVVPVKDPGRAKQRLAPSLTPAERCALARAMLEDVLDALAAARGLAGLLVVTGDAAAAAVARKLGARIIADRENSGHSAAVATAARALAAETAAGLLAVSADLPLITPAEIERVVAAHGPAPAVTLVPAVVDRGTNALAASPADAIPPQFGRDSFRRHCDAARAQGIEPSVLRVPGLGRDIDRPDDLPALIARPSRTRAYTYLEDSGIAARLRAMEVI